MRTFPLPQRRPQPQPRLRSTVADLENKMLENGLKIVDKIVNNDLELQQKISEEMLNIVISHAQKNSEVTLKELYSVVHLKSVVKKRGIDILK